MAVHNPTNLCILTMEKIYSYEEPKQIAYETQGDSTKRILNYDIREVTIDEIKDLWKAFLNENKDDQSFSSKPEDWFVSNHKWQYRRLTFPIGIWSYEDVVEAIIRDKYSQSEMESITNNMTAVLSGFLQDLATNGILSATKWLISNIDEDNATRFSEMQAWRKMAKDTAKSIFKNE